MRNKVRWSDLPLPEEFELDDTESVELADDTTPIQRIRKHSLGTGGMGKVYLAVEFDGVSTRKVAIKEAYESHIDDLRNEIEILSRFTPHPHIVQMLSSDNDGTELIMEYVEGQTLEKFAATPLKANELQKIMIGVATGLEFIHSQWKIHRDIKPANILLDGEGNPKICDFGLAISTNHLGIAYDSDRCGTPDFIAPESLEELSDSDEQEYIFYQNGDIYSFGVTLIVTITNDSAYDDSNITVNTFIDDRIDGTLQPQVPDNIHQSLQALIKGCLSIHSKRPSARELKVQAHDLIIDEIYNTEKNLTAN